MIQNYLDIDATFTAEFLKKAEEIWKQFAPVRTGNLRAHGIDVVPLGVNGIQVRVVNTEKVPYAVFPNYLSNKNAGWEDRASAKFTRYMRDRTGMRAADTYTYSQGAEPSVREELREQAQQMTEIQKKLDKLMKVIMQVRDDLDDSKLEALKDKLVKIFMNL